MHSAVITIKVYTNIQGESEKRHKNVRLFKILRHYLRSKMAVGQFASFPRFSRYSSFFFLSKTHHLHKLPYNFFLATR